MENIKGGKGTKSVGEKSKYLKYVVPRKHLSERVIFEQTPEGGEEVSYAEILVRVLPVAYILSVKTLKKVFLVGSWNGKDTNMAGAEGMLGTAVGNEVRQVMGTRL